MANEAPWIVTVYVAACGWIVMHVADRLTMTPTLEYSITKQAKADNSRIEVELTNLTRDKVFEDVVITLQGIEGTQIKTPMIVPVQPANDGSEAPSVTISTASYRLDRMLPGSIYRLSAVYSGNAMPRLRIASEKSAVRFVIRGWETSFVRYELMYLFTIGLVGGLLVFVSTGTRWHARNRVSESPGHDTNHMPN